ncbi:MAG: hypothetical protein CSA97_02080 [Bacteroidetes bacterium]|nr:MAG: hypothetical protein CSA97_02080 [Bacteroidota bacterium]
MKIHSMNQPNEGMQALTADQLARFTPDSIVYLSPFRRAYWMREFYPLLLSTIYRTSEPGMNFEGNRRLTDHLETIAAWDFHGMPREITRGDQGQILQIAYSINGQRVLLLSRVDAGGVANFPLVTFFCQDWRNGYNLGHERDVLEGLHELLASFPAFCTEHLALVEQKEIEHLKAQKIRSLAEANLEVLIPSLLSGTDYEYAFERGTRTTLLCIRLTPIRHLEISLPDRTFAYRVDRLLPTITLVKQLISRVSIPLTIAGMRRGIKWDELRVDPAEAPSCFSCHGPRKNLRECQMSILPLLRSSMQDSPYEYAISLRGPSQRYRTDVHVRISPKQVVTLGFSPFVQPETQQILPAIELVRETLESSPLPFKILPSNTPRYEGVDWIRQK